MCWSPRRTWPKYWSLSLTGAKLRFLPPLPSEYPSKIHWTIMQGARQLRCWRDLSDGDSQLDVWRRRQGKRGQGRFWEVRPQSRPGWAEDEGQERRPQSSLYSSLPIENSCWNFCVVVCSAWFHLFFVYIPRGPVSHIHEKSFNVFNWLSPRCTNLFLPNYHRVASSSPQAAPSPPSSFKVIHK